MSEPKKDNWNGLIILFFLMLMYLGGYNLAEIHNDKGWRKLMIQKGFAEYHYETGEWQWKKLEGVGDE